MKTRTGIFAALLIAATACSGPEGLDSTIGRDREGPGHGRSPEGGAQSPDPGPAGPSVFLSGVRYPDGYDWRHATDEAGHVVFLLGDGEPLFESPAAPAEADTRLISRGRLFYTVTEGDSTAIFADGIRLFAYGAREMTAALEDDGHGHILTIGEPRSTEEAFTYRVNGSAKMKKKGLLASEGIKDGEFHYRDSDGRYFIVENGTQKEAIEPAAGGIIAAAMMRGGKVYAYEKVGPFILIQSEGKGVHVAVPSSHYHDIRLEDWFFHDGIGFLTFVSAKDENGIPKAVIFRNDKEIRNYEGYGFYAILEDSGKLAFVLKAHDREEYAIASGEGLPEPLPEHFVPHSKRAMDYRHGILRLALDTPEGPVLWQDGRMVRYSFNGYIDNIDVR